MSAQPHQLEGVGVGFAIDEHQIGMDVAVSMALPLATEAVVHIASRQVGVGDQEFEEFNHVLVQSGSMLAACLTFVVLAKLAGSFNRPRAGRSSGRR